VITATIRLDATASPRTRSLDAKGIPYDFDVNFLKMPKDMYLGEVSGVAVNAQGHVFVFHRGTTSGPAYGAAAAQLLEFDQNGNYVREIGRNLYAWSFAHTVRVDRYDREIVPLAQERARVAAADYSGARADLGAVLEARRSLLEARLSALQAQAELARAWAQLAYLVPPEVHR